MAELNSLLESTLRKDPAKAKARQAAEVRTFLDNLGAERKAKLSETIGLQDVLTFLPAVSSAKAFMAGNPLSAAVNALAFTSQFDDSKLGQNVGDALAMFPVFGVGGTKGLARAQDRLRKMAELGKKGELPILKSEGKMAPRRFKQFEGRMRDWIDAGGAKDPSKQHELMDKWLETFKRDKPIDKRVIFDRMPSELRPALYQSAKEQGYGGISLGTRSKAPMDKFGQRVTKGENLAELAAEGKFSSGGRMNPTQVAGGGPRKWEEILKFEQSGGIPKGWEEAFKRQQYQERAKAGLELAGTGTVTGAAINALAPSGGESGDSKAGLIVNSRNIGRLKKEMDARLRVLNQRRPDRRDLNEIEAAFAAKYPKLYNNGLAGQGNVDFAPGKAGSGAYNPATGGIELQAPAKVGSRDERSAISKALSHEVMHANDFQRLGNINEPFTKNKIRGSEFVPIGAEPRVTKDILERMEIFNPEVASKAKMAGQEYITPQVAKDLYSGSSNATAKAAAKYRGQPVEQRAIMAGDTGRQSLDKLLDFDEGGGTNKDLASFLQVHKPKKTKWDELLEKVGLLK